MIKSYFKTAVRFLLNNRAFSFINLFGLAAGTLCCLYILLYVRDQYSYDRHHTHANDIYRITTDLVLTGDRHHNATASPPIAPAMKNDFAEVEQFTRVVPTLGVSKHLLQYKDKSFYEDKAVYVDSTFFTVFAYHFVHGQTRGVLDQPNTLVLLQPVADKLFGSEDPLDKVITITDGYGKHDFRVTGVVDESMGKSHLEANIFVTMRSEGIGKYVLQNTIWAGNNFANSYVRLRPDASAAALEQKLSAFLKKYGEQQMKTLGMEKQLHLQPVTSIHSTAGYENEITKTISPTFLNILLLIAALIQVIACINFMNLSTARAAKRAKEVGIRKVVGAEKGQLVRQFLAESFFLTLLSLLIALPLLMLAMPYLNQLTHTDIPLTVLSDWRIWLLLTGLAVFTGLIAGSYPAFYLSAFQAIKVLKGNFSNQVSVAGIRRSLVVFQFVLAIVLITGIIVIRSQLNYIDHLDLGFEKQQRLIFNFYTDDQMTRVPAFRNGLRHLAGVNTVSQGDNYLSQFVGHDHGVHLAGGDMATAIDAQTIAAGEDFVKAFGIKLLSGRDFRTGDSGRVLINETLAKRLGLRPETAAGTRLYWEYASEPHYSVEIAGVMKDFNYNSLHKEVAPFMFTFDGNQNDLSVLVVAANTSNYQKLLSEIKDLWSKSFSGLPFEYSFLDTEVQKQYESEIMLGAIINSFAGVAILISCLGLFGLAAFSAEQRIKEIGIRKVLGANVPGLVGLLSRDFLKLVLVSVIIAAPIAWWAMDKWLQSFVYRISVTWWMLALSGLLATAIALLTVGYQALRAAVANPVRNLRSE